MNVLRSGGRAIALATAALALLLATHAFAGERADLVGVWETRTKAGGTLAISLASGGKGTVRVRDAGGELTSEQAVEWSATGTKLSVVADGDTTVYAISLEGEVLMITGGNLDGPTPFRRKASGVIGKWRSDAGETFEVTPDACVIGPNRVPCSIGKDALTLTAPNGQTVTWPYVVEGDVLTLTIGAQKQVWKRAAPPAPPGPDKPPHPFRRASLVGKWRANDGNVIEFRADGQMLYGAAVLQYEAKDGKLTFAGETWQYRLEGTDKLVITLEGETQTLVRVGSAPEGQNPGQAAPPAGPDAPKGDPKGATDGADGIEPEKGGNPVGAWDTNKGCAILRPDGTGTCAGDDFKWVVEGTLLKFITKDNWIGMPFTATRDKLVLGKNPSVTCSRAGVAGVWVGEEATLDPGSYLSFTQYVVLHRDGTVGYAKSEGYASRTQVTDCVERFFYGKSAAGQPNQTYGTWKDEGSGVLTIKFNWRGDALRARYDLERMLMRIDGMGKLPGNEGGSLDFKRR